MPRHAVFFYKEIFVSKKDKTEKDKQKPEKKKKLPLGRTLQNTVFALKQVWQVSPPYFISYFLISILYAPVDFLSSTYLLKVIVDGVNDGIPTGKIITYIAVIAVWAIGTSIFSGICWNCVFPGVYDKVGAFICKKLFRSAAAADLSCYETPAFFDKYVKAMDEAHDRIYKVMNTLDNLIWRVAYISLSSLLLFTIDPWLILFALFPLILGIFRRIERKMRHKLTVEQKPINRRQDYVRRTFYQSDFAKEMRIGNMYLRMLNGYRESYYEFRKLVRKYGIRMAILGYIQSFGLEVLTIIGAVTYAVYKTVALGEMTIGDCIVILNAIGGVSYSLNNIVQNLAEFGEHALYIDDMRYFLDLEPKIKEDVKAPEAHGGDIVVDNVTFRYEGAEEDTLRGVSMRIKSGEKIALVGLNGSGKTTLVKLLMRLYDPLSGSITLDGRDAKEYRLSTYRDNYSCVFQDFKVFSLPVVENVTLRSRREGDTELVAEALKESGAYEKVTSLEKGVETTLTKEFDENGANLSVGEQQKVSLARVFISKAPCIILDEPSSALDPIAEHKMFQNMMRAAEGRSVIFISHRLSSAVSADRIYLMDKGVIAEEGTHHELMQKNGKYAEMFRLQAENYLGKEAEV